MRAHLDRYSRRYGVWERSSALLSGPDLEPRRIAARFGGGCYRLVGIDGDVLDQFVMAGAELPLILDVEAA